MKKMTAVMATVLVAVATVALPAAADTTRTGTIGATTIDGNVIVPADATCTLDGTTVDGNVLVGPRARLTVLGADIDGNIQDDNGNAGTVEVRDSSTDNIQLFSGTRLTVRNTLIDGDLQCQSNIPAPTGGANVVQGSAEGQCSNLEGPIAAGFVDVAPGSTHTVAIEWLVDAGITSGCDTTGTRFCPQDNVTRAQMATFLFRALGNN